MQITKSTLEVGESPPFKAGFFKVPTMDRSTTWIAGLRAGATAGRRLTRLRRPSAVHLLLFVRELRALVKAGVPIPESVRLLAERTEHQGLKRALGGVASDLGQGRLLSQAIEAQARTFPPAFAAIVRAGEASGTLPDVLARYGEWLDRRVALQRKVVSSLAYPAVMGAAFGAILLFLFLYVLPRFAAIYADMEVDLPVPTRILIAVVGGAWKIAPVALPVLGLAVWSAVRHARSEAGRRRIDASMIRVPVIGSLARGLAAAQTARTLELLLRGGIPLVPALSITAQAVGNSFIRAGIARVKGDVEQGKGIARSLEACGVVPPITARMLEVGERSGSLVEMLGETANFHEGEVEARLSTLTSLLEPVLMLSMGVIVGTLIVVMYLPIFSLAEAVR